MKNGGAEQLHKWTQAYLACVAFVDDQVGKVLDAIESRADAENTLIIFTSDHGYHMGEKEYLFKFTPWEESVRIPLVVAGPGVAQGLECARPVALLNLYRCIDYAGMEAAYRLDASACDPCLKTLRRIMGGPICLGGGIGLQGTDRKINPRAPRTSISASVQTL